MVYKVCLLWEVNLLVINVLNDCLKIFIGACINSD